MSTEYKLTDNMIQPFQLESSHLRGRAVRLGGVLNDILQPHNYPYPVAHLVAEMTTLALLLSSMLKYDGIFTLQARGDGPVSMVVADVISNGDVRACATFDEERLDLSREALNALKTPESANNHLAQYLGKGHMAFTVDQAGGQDRYQGIVELGGASLIDCVNHYFMQSEQIVSGIKISAGLRYDQWRAGGIMLQKMPENDGNSEDAGSNIEEDDWRRAMILLDSCQDDEFLSPDLSASDLLFRLFHQEGVRIYDAFPVQKNCRCSNERVENMVRSLNQDDLDYLIKDEKIEVKCDFCSKDYALDPKKLTVIS